MERMRTLVRLRCRGCGYGVSVRAAPESCPMCRSIEWEHEDWRPYSAFSHDLLPHRRLGREHEPPKVSR